MYIKEGKTLSCLEFELTWNYPIEILLVIGIFKGGFKEQASTIFIKKSSDLLLLDFFEVKVIYTFFRAVWTGNIWTVFNERKIVCSYKIATFLKHICINIIFLGV